MSKLKISSWDGPNKSRVRMSKLSRIRSFVGRTRGNMVPRMLTFPGTTARLERMVSVNDVVVPSNMVAIQTYETMSEGHRGEPLLKQLMKTRDNHLPGMYIWPYNFESFSSLYTLNGLSRPAGGAKKKFNLSPFRKEMNKVVDRPATKFNILDLDYCGIFSSKNASSVTNLMSNKVLDRCGIMFVTHQKGRDVRGGNLMNILNEYLLDNSMVDYDSIPGIHEEDVSFAYYAARYIMIPMFYVGKAFDNGYVMKLDRLIEYRDKNSGSGLAVNMLQYMFSWVQYDNVTYDLARRNMLSEIEKIRLEKYMYTNWVD